MNHIRLLLIIALFCTFQLSAHSTESLTQQINLVLEGKDATVGVAILGEEPGNFFSINGDKKLPMQSIFKYHLAVAVLDQVDKGRLSLTDEIEITKQDLDNNLWSPLRTKYPNGARLPLSEVLEYTVAYSDNVGCDILFKILGGPKVLENFMHQKGITDIAIEHDERAQQSVWDRQYENWTTAESALSALKLFYENKHDLLSAESHRFLWNIMKSSNTGGMTIRGGLPKGTVVAHKTGSSGKNAEGLTGARNDIGIVFLPDGRYFYISVLVSNSLEPADVNNKIISDIAKLAWGYFNKPLEAMNKPA